MLCFLQYMNNIIDDSTFSDGHKNPFRTPDITSICILYFLENCKVNINVNV